MRHSVRLDPLPRQRSMGDSTKAGQRKPKSCPNTLALCMHVQLAVSPHLHILTHRLIMAFHTCYCVKWKEVNHGFVIRRTSCKHEPQRASSCQPRQWFDSHPTLTWTQAHQSKAKTTEPRRLHEMRSWKIDPLNAQNTDMWCFCCHVLSQLLVALLSDVLSSFE